METRCEFSKLTIPNDRLYVKVAATYVDEIAKKLGFEEKDRADIRSALTQAIEDTIEHAFESYERTTFDISCERVALGLKVVIRDMGMPFDPHQSSTRNLGNSPGENLMDEVSFANLGRDGKETTLIKYIRNREIKDYLEACSLEPYEQAAVTRTSVSRPIHFTVRHMKPDEAIDVSRAVYRAYGYSYAIPHVYFPERIAELNASGQMYSAVAVTANGDLAGHCALFEWNATDRTAELGLAVVKPEYRAQGIFNALTDHLIVKARSEGLMGVFGQAVTNHTYSQQVGHRCGMRDCAIALAVVPETESFRGITERLSQRDSLVVHFKYLHKPERLTVFPPSHHKEIIGKLYNNLEIEPEILVDPQTPVALGQSVIKTRAGGPMGFARIEVKHLGEDVVSQVRSALKDLCLKRFEVIHLLLDLCDPATSAYVERFEALGFFFAGILPGGCAGDGLILQYLNNVPLDYGKIKVESQIGRELLAYIKKLDPNL
ncbi:MAG: GNAT family N-acetyltransferase [Desulfomonile tiedjei]|uniref:GNAT family N-acetyltransferase n=1 Tax=Desulfomonile tiedjei TaxID=2358 RepID=A0A9D6V685_9BACT|nr:GNAT family N-acetyltransferase [Desulfomonile tiedjei]